MTLGDIPTAELRRVVEAFERTKEMDIGDGLHPIDERKSTATFTLAGRRHVEASVEDIRAELVRRADA